MVRAAVVLAGVAVTATLATACSATVTAERRSAPVSSPGFSMPVLHGSTGATTPARPATPATSAAPKPDPCARNTAVKAVLVHLRTQHMWLCRGRTTAYDSPVTSGIPGEDTHTPTGTYRVQVPSRHTTLNLADGSSYAVRYWIPFDAPLFGFHDSPWQRFPYGSPQYRTRGSHGCVHLPLRAIARLYRFADVGTPVRISA